MKDVTKSDLRRRNPLDRRALTEDEIDSIHLANIAREFHAGCHFDRLICLCAENGCLMLVLEEIGQRLHVRQIIIYTAVIFYRRFYQTYARSLALSGRETSFGLLTCAMISLLQAKLL
jgi:hypothetical protein